MNFRTKIICLISVVFFFSVVDISIAIEKKSNLFDFMTIISKYGWQGRLYELKFPATPEITMLSTELYYVFPEDDGYHQRLTLFQLSFNKIENIPFYDGKIEQIYPNSYHEGRFPIDKFGHILNVPSHFKTKWNAYRYENSVYIIYAGPTRQDIDSMHQFLIKFTKLNVKSNKEALKQFEESIKSEYTQNKEFYEGVMILQEAFISKGYYHSYSLDGIFGSVTKKSLQTFLKRKGYYDGDVDSMWGKGSIKALKNFQKDMNIDISGRINLETAKLIKKILEHE
jgi:hypothetical protein